jgi:formylglycine-generating enzyme required for sulfatase activity
MGAGGWHWNDAWIFVSTVIAERLERDRAMHAALPVTGASLADVLAAADFLHHSVPSRAELEDSLRRLAGAGLLTVDDDIVGLSSAVVTLQTQLNRAATPGEFDWKLDEQTYNAAVREYSLRLADGR